MAKTLRKTRSEDKPKTKYKRKNQSSFRNVTILYSDIEDTKEGESVSFHYLTNNLKLEI